MDSQDRYRLAGETGVSRPTIDKWLRDPSSVQTSTRYALEQGCKRLRLSSPHVDSDSSDESTG